MSPDETFTLAELLVDIEQRGQRRDSIPTKRLLIDMRLHAEKINPIQNLLLCHHMALHYQGMRVAPVVGNRTGQGQRVARTIGLDLRAFESVDEALEWLMEGLDHLSTCNIPRQSDACL